MANKALHLTDFSPRSKSASELYRYATGNTEIAKSAVSQLQINRLLLLVAKIRNH